MRPLSLGILLLPWSIAACSANVCDNNIDVWVFDVAMDERIRQDPYALQITLTTSDHRKQQTFDVSAELADGATSMEIFPDPSILSSDTGTVSMALFSRDLTVIGRAQQTFTSSDQGCQHSLLTLTPSADESATELEDVPEIAPTGPDYQEVRLTPADGELLEDFQVALRLPPGPDPGDLRFLDHDQNNSLPYWIAPESTGGQRTIWVRVPQIPPTGTSIFVATDNPQPPDPQATFQFFLGFEAMPEDGIAFSDGSFFATADPRGGAVLLASDQRGRQRAMFDHRHQGNVVVEAEMHLPETVGAGLNGLYVAGTPGDSAIIVGIHERQTLVIAREDGPGAYHSLAERRLEAPLVGWFSLKAELLGQRIRAQVNETLLATTTTATTTGAVGVRAYATAASYDNLRIRKAPDARVRVAFE